MAGAQVQETVADHGDPAPNSSPSPSREHAAASAPGAPDTPAALAGSCAGGSGFTLKAMAAGLLGIAAVSLYTSFNDRVLSISPLIGNHLPIGALSYVFALAVLWNPTVGRLGAWLRFGTREMAVILGMLFITSWIPGSSFYRYLQDTMTVPTLHAANNPSWKANGTLGYIPDGLEGRWARMRCPIRWLLQSLPSDPATTSSSPARRMPLPLPLPRPWWSAGQKPGPSAYTRVYANLTTGDEKLRFAGRALWRMAACDEVLVVQRRSPWPPPWWR